MPCVIKLLFYTHNLFGFQDRSGLPGQRSLEGLDCNNLHHSAVAIETIHILPKLQWKKNKKHCSYCRH